MAEVDRALHRKVDRVADLANTLAAQVATVHRDVKGVNLAQRQTHQELLTFQQQFLAHVKQTERNAILQRAHTQVGVVEARVEHEFGHHNEVRRSATGILQGFDTGLVSEETVVRMAEEHMIKSPRYWLAPALVALAAWSADDRKLCDRAVETAFQRSPTRTSLLFALILRRQERQHSSVRWLRHYLVHQDPSALGREFGVILESVSQGAFGPAGRDLLQATLATWRGSLMNDQAAQDSQVRLWWAELEALRDGVPPDRYPRLAQVSPQWPELRAALVAARAHRTLLDKYTPMMVGESTPSQRIEDAVDDILDQLVTEYDPEELPLRRELALHQAIIAHEGDEDAARLTVDRNREGLAVTQDYLTLQTMAALNPSAGGASPATQRLSVAACSGWFAEAHAGFSRDYRAALPDEVRAEVEAEVTVGSRKVRIPSWSGALATPYAELESSLGDHWDKYTGPLLATLDFPLAKWMAGPVVAAVVLFAVLVGANAPIAVVLAIGVGGGWAVAVKNQYEKALKTRKDTEFLLKRQKKEILSELAGARAELTDWETEYRSADALGAEAREFILSLATATAAGSPFEGRTVDTEGEDRTA